MKIPIPLVVFLLLEMIFFHLCFKKYLKKSGYWGEMIMTSYKISLVFAACNKRETRKQKYSICWNIKAKEYSKEKTRLNWENVCSIKIYCSHISIFRCPFRICPPFSNIIANYLYYFFVVFLFHQHSIRRGVHFDFFQCFVQAFLV